MNRVVTSKEELLKAAGEIVFEEGPDKLNIRYLAKKCNIASGSVYNYFPSKADLVIALTEEFWRTVFHPEVCHMPGRVTFVEFYEQVYHRLSKHLREFKTLFLGQLGVMKAEDKTRGRTLEHTYFSHMLEGFLNALKQDTSIRENIWGPEFTREQFVDFLFSNMLHDLMDGKEDCTFVKEMINRILYV